MTAFIAAIAFLVVATYIATEELGLSHPDYTIGWITGIVFGIIYFTLDRWESQ